MWQQSTPPLVSFLNCIRKGLRKRYPRLCFSNTNGNWCSSTRKMDSCFVIGWSQVSVGLVSVWEHSMFNDSRTLVAYSTYVLSVTYIYGTRLLVPSRVHTWWTCCSTCMVTSYSVKSLLCCVFTVMYLYIRTYQILKVVIATKQRKDKLAWLLSSPCYLQLQHKRLCHSLVPSFSGPRPASCRLQYS